MFSMPGITCALPNRLVCGIDLYADADHSRHPHEENPVYPKPCQLAIDYQLSNNRRSRCLADSFSLAGTLGFVTLPPLFWLYLAGLMVGYVILTQLVKTWFYHRYNEITVFPIPTASRLTKPTIYVFDKLV